MGADGSGTSTASPTSDREFVAPSEYPTEEVLAEMVDPYEALVCWFYLPDGGSSDVGGGAADGAGGGDGDGGGSGRSGYGQEVACFVAYHDEGKPRPSDDHDGAKTGQGGKNTKAVTDLEAKRAAIAARARGRRQQGEDADDGGSQNSDSSISSGGGSDDGGGGSDDELDAEDFEPGALRVRVILASPGTTQQLRKATEVFLKTLRNRNPVSMLGVACFVDLDGRQKKFINRNDNPFSIHGEPETNVFHPYGFTTQRPPTIAPRQSQVKRNVLSAFALQDLSIALGVPKIFKAFPPHIQVPSLRVFIIAVFGGC